MRRRTRAGLRRSVEVLAVLRARRGAWTQRPCRLRLAFAAAMKRAASAVVGSAEARVVRPRRGRHNRDLTVRAYQPRWRNGSRPRRRAPHWTDRCMSLEVEAPELTFVAGQFARLALPAPPGAKDPMIGRPYSFVNPPDAPRATSSTSTSCRTVRCRRDSPRSSPAIRSGSCRARTVSSAIAEVPQAEALWCISTGTGIGPFLSILRTAEPWEKFGRVVLVHAVRHGADLAYRDVIAGIAREHAGAFAFVPVVSREPHAGALPGRIPALIADGRLESRAGVPLTADNAHAMLCGNPAMVDDVQAALAARADERHRRKRAGAHHARNVLVASSPRRACSASASSPGRTRRPARRCAPGRGRASSGPACRRE